MEIIALDIDGVLNTACTRKQFRKYRSHTDEVEQEDYFKYGIEDHKLSLLEEFYEQRESLHTVISSDWRSIDILDLEDFQKHFDLRVIDKTARGYTNVGMYTSPRNRIPRDKLILNWLETTDHTVDAWVVVDDQPEPLTRVEDHAIITNSIEGLNEFTIQDIRDKLDEQLDNVPSM